MFSKAGLRTSQDLTYLPDFPEQAPVSSWRSYLLTAAGQFRSFTGFPFHTSIRSDRGILPLYLEAYSTCSHHLWIKPPFSSNRIHRSANGTVNVRRAQILSRRQEYKHGVPLARNAAAHIAYEHSSLRRQVFVKTKLRRAKIVARQHGPDDPARSSYEHRNQAR
jgi:hypothetical protein